jgi:hypothetical protein
MMVWIIHSETPFLWWAYASHGSYGVPWTARTDQLVLWSYSHQPGYHGNHLNLYAGESTQASNGLLAEVQVSAV